MLKSKLNLLITKYGQIKKMNQNFRIAICPAFKTIRQDSSTSFFYYNDLMISQTHVLKLF